MNNDAEEGKNYEGPYKLPSWFPDVQSSTPRETRLEKW